MSLKGIAPGRWSAGCIGSLKLIFNIALCKGMNVAENIVMALALFFIAYRSTERSFSRGLLESVWLASERDAVMPYEVRSRVQ